MPAMVVCPVPPLIKATVPVILDALTVVDKVVQLGIPLASCNTCPLVPLANKAVVLLADWYGIDPTSPPSILVAVNAVPFKLAVIVFAEKFPISSLDTIAYEVLLAVAEVALLLTLPIVEIVAKFASVMPAVPDKLELVSPCTELFTKSLNCCGDNRPTATHPVLLKFAVVNLYKESLDCTYTSIPCFLLLGTIASLEAILDKLIKPPWPKLSKCVGYNELASCVAA